jgi:hypothetical protein
MALLSRASSKGRLSSVSFPPSLSCYQTLIANGEAALAASHLRSLSVPTTPISFINPPSTPRRCYNVMCSAAIMAWAVAGSLGSWRRPGGTGRGRDRRAEQTNREEWSP